MSDVSGEMEEAGFAEFRRKVRTAEVLSAAVERLLSQIRFNGKGQRNCAERPGAQIRVRRGLFPQSSRHLRKLEDSNHY